MDELQLIIRIASLLDLGTQRTPRNTLEMVRRPNDQSHIGQVAFNDLLYGAIVNMQPLVEPPSILSP